MNSKPKEHFTEMKHVLKVKDIKRFLENNQDLDDEAVVMIERIEDRYFDGFDISGFSTSEGIAPTGKKSDQWSVYLVEGESYNWAKQFEEDLIEEVKIIKEGGERQFPFIENPEEKIGTYDDWDKLKDQYQVANCFWRYPEQKDIVFLAIHY
jgi:hypothetical protein